MATISVEKITDVNLLRRANSFTTSKESKMSLAKAYKHGHSPIRTQLFWVELTEIPLFVASQLVRSHIGVQFFQLSKRTDRGGANFRDECEAVVEGLETQIECINEPNGMIGIGRDSVAVNIKEMVDIINEFPGKFDRFAPTDLAFICNAEAIINMAHKRLCNKASKETREVFQGICDEIERRDPDLFNHLVPQCVFRGICPEPKCCGYIHTPAFDNARKEYVNLFND